MRFYRIIAAIIILTAFACSSETKNNISMDSKPSAYIELMKQFNNDEEFYKADSILNMYIDNFGNYKGIEALASIIYSNIGGQLITDNYYDSAYAYLVKADSIYPDNKRALKLLAKMYAMADVLDTADMYIERALLIDTLDAETFLIIGNIALLRGRGMNAQNAYMKALHIDTTYTEAYLNLAILFYRTENYAYALKLFKETIKYDSLNIVAYDYIISTYTNAGLTDSALKYAETFERKKMDLREENSQ